MATSTKSKAQGKGKRNQAKPNAAKAKATSKAKSKKPIAAKVTSKKPISTRGTVKPPKPAPKAKKPVAPKAKAKAKKPVAPKAKAKARKPVAPKAKARKPVAPKAKAKAKKPVAPKAKAKARKPVAPKAKVAAKKPVVPKAKAKRPVAPKAKVAAKAARPTPAASVAPATRAAAAPQSPAKREPAPVSAPPSPTPAPAPPAPSSDRTGATSGAAAGAAAAAPSTASAATGRPAWMTAYEGRIVRHDLMSTDPARSKAFYGELFGWVLKDVPEFGVTRISVAGVRLGAIIPLDPAHGYPSHWVPYPCVADVDHTCAEVRRRGGTVCVGAMDLPIGRFAVCEFPPKALFSPFTPLEPPTLPDGPPPVGAFCWDELMTPDVPAARAFYAGLFGWDTIDVPMPGLDYVIAKRGDRQGGGLMKSPPAAPGASYWLAYVAVEDVDAAAAHAERLGGRVVAPPQDIPGIGRFAVLLDPSGASIAVFRGGAM